MRLGLLTQYFPPEIGAPQARLGDLVARFVARGHEVWVLTAMPSYPRGRIYEGYGGFVRRERIGGARVVRTFVYPTQSVAKARRLASYFSFVASSLVPGGALLPRLDYLMTESPPLFLGISGFLLSRAKRARWIFNVSDLWPDSAVELGVIGEGFALRSARRLEAFCYRSSWLVTCQSRGILESIRTRFPGTRTHHLPHGVDLQMFRPRAADPETRRRLAGEGAAGCVAIYTGLHGIAQGLDSLLAAAERLRDVKDLRIILVGDGPEKARLMKKARDLDLDNVHFHEPCPRNEVPGLLAAADLALVPLKKQLTGAIPSKIYEAMGASLPVVLLAAGETARVVEDAGAGIVVTPGDGDGLVAALRGLATDPHRRKALGEAGRRAAEGLYDRRAIGDGFIDLLEAES